MDVIKLSNLLSSCWTTNDEKGNEYDYDKLEELKENDNITIKRNDDAPSNTDKKTSEKGRMSMSNDNNDDVWDINEIPSDQSITTKIDYNEKYKTKTKVEPKYQIYYKQSIGAHDITANKTSCSNDGDSIIIKIRFPYCSNSKDIKLDITKTTLIAETKDE